MSLIFLLLLIGADVLRAAEQIHLSLGADASQMIVTWVTPERPSNGSKVIFHEVGGPERSATGGWQEFSPGKGRTIYVHRVLMKNLTHGMTYHYKVYDKGDESGKKYLFRVPVKETSVKLLVFGDMGTKDAISVPGMIREIENQTVDAVFHVGDMAYDMEDDEGRNGDQFMRMIEPIAANVPYQVMPGNHETANNFSHYNNLFSMTDSTSGHRNNFFYSTSIGPLHIISVNTEFYFSLEYGTEQIQSQYNWLVSDLIKAAGNRKAHPWIVVMSHRPMYCSADRYQSREDMHTVREGISGRFGLEEILHKFKVDLYISGHAHVYERSYPVFWGEVKSQNDSEYHNPDAPVHLVTGSAGSSDGLHEFWKVIPKWSAKRMSSYGYTRLSADRTTITVQQVSAQDGRVIDEFQITKDYTYK